MTVALAVLAGVLAASNLVVVWALFRQNDLLVKVLVGRHTAFTAPRRPEDDKRKIAQLEANLAADVNEALLGMGDTAPTRHQPVGADGI